MKFTLPQLNPTFLNIVFNSKTIAQATLYVDHNTM